MGVRAAELTVVHSGADSAGGGVSGRGLVWLSLVYLALPMPIFLLGWLKLPYALALAGLLVWLLLRFMQSVRAEVRPGLASIVICGMVALLWTSAAGHGGIGSPGNDHPKHFAIFKLLHQSDWPAMLDDTRVLVYTLGYYLPAAAIGKVFGWVAANVVLFLWSFAGVWLALLWFVHLVGESLRRKGAAFVKSKKSKWAALWLAPLFVILSGMDIVAWLIYQPFSLQPGVHIEWAGSVPRGYGYQYSSMTTLLYYVPQHALSGWLGAALFLQLKDEPGFYRSAMLLGACLALWSFFAALGVALLIVLHCALKPSLMKAALWPHAAFLQQMGGILLQLAGGALLLMVALYLASSDFNIVREFYALTTTEQGQWPRYALFVTLEFALLGVCALLLLRADSTQGADRQTGLFVAVLVVLLALPLYKVGHAHDMAKCTSVPILFAFWRLALPALAAETRRLGPPLAAYALKGVIAAAIALGAATPYMELHRTLGGDQFVPPPGTGWQRVSSGYNFAPPPIEEVKGMDDFARYQTERAQYVGHRQSFFFRHLARQP